MTLPRQVIPGRFYMITRRCTQRQFLMRPDDETNNAFAYCVAVAAKRAGIDVVLPSAMSNHHHTTVYDRAGTIIDFVEYLHCTFAKCMNARRGRWENFWASEQVNLVHLEGPEDVLRKLVYCATNPVKDELVARVADWPGFNGFLPLIEQRVIETRRPRHYFSPTGTMPATATLELVIPPELGDRDEFLRKLRERVALAEQRFARRRERRGRRVMGARAVLRQSWRDYPKSRARRRGIRPTLASRNKWTRIEALRRNKRFIRDYAIARRDFLDGKPAVFPVGTYWLHRFAGVPVVEPCRTTAFN